MARGSVQEYARHREALGLGGGTRAGVYKALEWGWIKRERDKSIDFEKADAGWLKHSRGRIVVRKDFDPPTGDTRTSRPNFKGEDPDDTVTPPGARESYSRARTRKETALADKAELEVRIKLGEIIPVERLERLLTGIGATVRQNLQSLPMQAAPTLAAMTDIHGITDYLDTEINGALTKLTRELDNLLSRLDAPIDFDPEQETTANGPGETSD